MTRSRTERDISKQDEVRNSRTSNELRDRFLSEIHANPMIRYEELARRVNVSVGLVATFMRKCVKAELLEVRKLSARRFVYLLTPKGVMEMMGRHYRRFSRNLDFFFGLSERFREVLGAIQRDGFRDVLLWVDDREGEGKVHNWVEVTQQHIVPYGLNLAGVIVRGRSEEEVRVACPVHVGDEAIRGLDLSRSAVLVVRSWFEDADLLREAVPHRYLLTEQSMQVLMDPGKQLLANLGIRS